ncbi:MAG: MoxR family ATPase [Desulfobacteraceae bacterium]|nr:MoxR family ATPase [Desulfobacteraceae bacterium]
MTDYPFDLVPPQADTPIKDNSWLAKRPFIDKEYSLKEDARYFVAGKALADTINTAIAVGKPLLLTGEPGTGKTQAAYYAAWRLNVECIHFQVKSESTANDLLYDFDTVRYFRDAHLHNISHEQSSPEKELKKTAYLEMRSLWKAFDLANKKGVPQVLLIDEIDKAPRDFPNDLLHELDQMNFTITETGRNVSAPPQLRPIVFITSNSERRLPEPFLRRCVYHHIAFDDRIVIRAVAGRRHEFHNLSNDFLEMALKRFLALRDQNLRKPPATSEYLVWLRVLSLAVDKHLQQLEEDLSKLPYLSILLKDHQDIEELV